MRTHIMFYEKLKYARLGYSMTQQQLADKCGIPVAAISHYEKGRRVPSMKNFCLLCNALDVESDF